MKLELTRAELISFYNKFKVNPITECWVWIAAHESNGYGCFSTSRLKRARVSARAHRISYMHYIGEIPKDKVLDHLCRVRNCVNPSHLEVVSNEENIRRGKNTKLNQEKVNEIRRLYATGQYYQSDLAKMFGVRSTAIYRIVNNIGWKEADRP